MNIPLPSAGIRRSGWLNGGALLAGALWSSAATNDSSSLANLSFEQLSQVQVLTVSKHLEPLANSAAAVAVVTADEIRRMGATALPETLRYVPGLDVAMVNSSAWSVSARGFNGQFANQLLVMIDGRSIYNPSFGGVFWEAQDTLFDGIDRIEVVRGPGGALWGANAVNGVINILTKSARETQGMRLSACAGDFNEGLFDGRYGFKLSADAFARVFIKYERRGESPLNSGAETPDDWSRVKGGFRLDTQLGADASFTFQGDALSLEEGVIYQIPNFTPPVYASSLSARAHQKNANLLGRYTKHFDADSTLTAQAYVDRVQQSGQVFSQRLTTWDVDVQYSGRRSERHLLTAGIDYRAMFSTMIPTTILSVPGRNRAEDQLLSLFAQDELALVRDTLTLTLGAKLEHNDYSGWEFAPSLRLLWHPRERQTLWAAVSQAVTTPGQLTSGMAYNLSVVPPGLMVQIQGQSHQAENLTACELGYRIQPTKELSVDVVAFHNNYTDLLVTETGRPNLGVVPPVVPVAWSNRIGGQTDGVEVALGWQALERCRFQGSYTWFQSDVTRGSVGRGDRGSSPKHKLGLRTSVDLNPYWELDTGVRYVARLPGLNVPGYWEAEARLAWKPNVHWELALVGQNLLHPEHFEFPRGLNPLQSEVPRSFYGRATWSF